MQSKRKKKKEWQTKRQRERTCKSEEDACCLQHTFIEKCTCLCCIQLYRPLQLGKEIGWFLQFFHDYVCNLPDEKSPFLLVLQEFADMKNHDDYDKAWRSLMSVCGCMKCADSIYWGGYPIDILPRGIRNLSATIPTLKIIRHHIDWLYDWAYWRLIPKPIFHLILHLSDACDILELCKLYRIPDEHLAFLRKTLEQVGISTKNDNLYCPMGMDHRIQYQE